MPLWELVLEELLELDELEELTLDDEAELSSPTSGPPVTETLSVPIVDSASSFDSTSLAVASQTIAAVV